MLNIVIPMAGRGSRFEKENYKLPKPFLDLRGKMMIERVLDGLQIEEAKYTLIIQEKFTVENKRQLEIIADRYDVNFVSVSRLTSGSACTALAAHEIINNENPVLFADCDNIFTTSVIKDFMNDAKKGGMDGSILSFESRKDCFSYAELDDNGYIRRMREKEVISQNAIAGIYMFKHGSDFVKCAIDMLIYSELVKGEYYMSTVCNQAIMRNLKMGIFKIQDADWACVGTPEQLDIYLQRIS